MKSFEVRVVILYFLHLCFDVSIRDDCLGADDVPFREIETIKQDWNLGFQGNIVEASFPFWLSLTRSFRSDAESELLSLLCLLGNDVRRMHLFASIDGNATKLPHQDSHGPEEPFLLHQEIAMKALGPTVEVADDEVPVARVRGKGYDAFVGHRFRDGFLEVEPSEKNLIAKRFKHYRF